MIAFLLQNDAGTEVAAPAGSAEQGAAETAATEESSGGPLDWLRNTKIPIGDVEITPSGILVAILIVALSFPVSSVLQRITRRALSRLRALSEGAIGSCERLLHYGVVTLGVLVAIEALGIDLRTLLTAGAVFAVAIGFAMQNISQNFVSGVILLLERTIKPGDILEVEGRIVRVVDMGIRTTVARTLEDEELIVPNFTLVQNTVKNLTLHDPTYRLRAPVGVVYGSDMKLVRETLEAVGRSMPWRVQERPPRVLLREFGDNAVLWEVSVWSKDPWSAAQQHSELNEGIWWALKENGIVIAFPQLDLHLDPRIEEALRRRAGLESA